MRQSLQRIVEPVSRFWRHGRAFLIAFAIFLGCVDGLPMPPKGKERGWQKPVTEVVRPVQQKILKPFKFVTKWARFHQRWALFQAVGVKQWRMEISGRTADGQWQIIYRANDTRYEAYKDMLEFRKIRASWNPTDTMSGYNKFANWIMNKVLKDYPLFTASRVRMEKVRLDRGAVNDTGEFSHVQVRERPKAGSPLPKTLPVKPPPPPPDDDDSLENGEAVP